MHPPEWICKELERIHPHLRLGWVGYARKSGEDELNKGVFALIQLYHSRDASRTFYTLWETVENRGPVFGSRYDPLSRTPIYVSELAPEDVFSGACIPMIRRWMRPMKQRYMESAVAKGKQYESDNQDLAEAQADYMLWHANKTDGSSDRTITNADLTKHDKAVLAGETKKDLTSTFTKVADGMALA